MAHSRASAVNAEGAPKKRLSPRAADEGAGLGQLSLRRHLIRPFGPPSPQGEGFGAVQPDEGFPPGGKLSAKQTDEGAGPG